MFLVHPTRLSKIFADSRTHPCGNARHRQASKLVGHARAKSRMRSPKMITFEKELPGRPYSAPAVARAEFCYHSLQEGLNLFYHTARRVSKPTRPTAVRPSNSATHSEYQNHYRQASPACNYFCAGPHAGGLWPFIVVLLSITYDPKTGRLPCKNNNPEGTAANSIERFRPSAFPQRRVGNRSS
jgi:hypothetical protein